MTTTCSDVRTCMQRTSTCIVCTPFRTSFNNVKNSSSEVDSTQRKFQSWCCTLASPKHSSTTFRCSTRANLLVHIFLWRVQYACVWCTKISSSTTVEKFFNLCVCFALLHCLPLYCVLLMGVTSLTLHPTYETAYCVLLLWELMWFAHSAREVDQ